MLAVPVEQVPRYLIDRDPVDAFGGELGFETRERCWINCMDDEQAIEILITKGEASIGNSATR
jgi:hypothetical protein